MSEKVNLNSVEKTCGETMCFRVKSDHVTLD